MVKADRLLHTIDRIALRVGEAGVDLLSIIDGNAYVKRLRVGPQRRFHKERLSGNDVSQAAMPSFSFVDPGFTGAGAGGGLLATCSWCSSKLIEASIMSPR